MSYKNVDDRKAYHRAWYQRNRERVIAKNKLWKAANPEKLKFYDRRAYERAHPGARKNGSLKSNREYNLHKYGLTEESFAEMLLAQLGLCAICRVRPGRFVDHDHLTGAVRGILCSACNRSIALLGDTSDGVRRALAYLERADG